MTDASPADRAEEHVEPWIEQLCDRQSISWSAWIEVATAIAEHPVDADAAFDAWLRALTPMDFVRSSRGAVAPGDAAAP